MNCYPLHSVIYGTKKFYEIVEDLCDLYYTGDCYLSMDDFSQVNLEAVVEDDRLLEYLFRAHKSKGKKKHKIKLFVPDGQDLVIHLKITKKKSFKPIEPVKFYECV